MIWQGVDKIPKLGYSIDTRGATSRSVPPLGYEEIIATLRGRRLSLLIINQKNQVNDSHNECAELE